MSAKTGKLCASANSLRLLTARFSTQAQSISVTSSKSLRDIPGPSTYPVLGQLHHFMPFGMFWNLKHANDMISVLHDKYGSVVRVGPVLQQPVSIFLFDTNDVEQVLRNENNMPVRAGFEVLKHFRESVFKDQFDGMSGLIVDQGESWKRFRSITNPVMLQPKTIRLYAASIDQVAQDMVQRLKRIRNADNTISGDFEIEMNKWALESIAIVGLGQRIGCLEDDLPEDSPARQMIQCVRDCFEVLDELDFKPSLWKYVSTPMYKKGMAIFEKQVRLSEAYISIAIENMKKRDTQIPDEDKSILEKLLQVNEKVALIMASDMLFAGVDTAAHTMMTLLYHLAKNPEKQTKLRAEVRSGDRKYVRACMKENMRISPVVTGNMRRLTKDLNVSGYFLPKGTDVVFPHEFISQQEDQYRRAKDFIPERWLVPKDDPLHYSSAHPMATIPFGHGVRSCIGRRIAELEIETFLTRMVETFKIEWKGPPPNMVTKSLNYMKPPYYYVLKDAD